MTTERQMHLAWPTLCRERLKLLDRVAPSLPAIQARLLRAIHRLLTDRELTEGRIPAEALAVELGASKRTVYRARAGLVARGLLFYAEPDRQTLAAGGWYKVHFGGLDDVAECHPVTAECHPVTAECHPVTAECQIFENPPPADYTPPKELNPIHPPASALAVCEIVGEVEPDEEAGWRMVEMDLIKAGVGDRGPAIEHCRRLGVEAEEILRLIAWWRAQPNGKWGGGALRRRILDHAPGVDFAENWQQPRRLPESPEKRSHQIAQAERRAVEPRILSDEERDALQTLLEMDDLAVDALADEVFAERMAFIGLHWRRKRTPGRGERTNPMYRNVFIAGIVRRKLDAESSREQRQSEMEVAT